MTSFTLDRNVMENLVGKKFYDEELRDKIVLMGVEVDNMNEKEIIVDITPNRPDLLSDQGFSRAFASFIGEKKGLKDYKTKSSGEKLIVDKNANEVRPYTACAIVKNLKFNDEKIKEIIQIQEKLHGTYGRNRKKLAIGIYPLEKIKFPVTYCAKKPEDILFVPLEESKEMNGFQILSQTKTGKEFAHLLDGKELYPIFIDANKQILSMPPIINSDNVGKITQNTNDVFVECSGFDYDALSKCLNIIVTALADMGGEIYSLEINYADGKKISPDLNCEEMKIDINYVNKILGLKLSEAEVKDCLEKMGFSYEKNKVKIPCYRIDILHERDFVEDIAIGYGYNNFKAEIPKVATIGEEDKFEKFCSKVANILVGLKCNEVSTYHLLSLEELNDKMLLNYPPIKVSSASIDFSYLRNWMIPSLMRVLTGNQHNEYPQNIFEIGICFKVDPKEETHVKEFKRLAICLCDEKADFTMIKQVLDALCNAIDVKYEVREINHDSFISGRCARVTINGLDVAYIGEINPQVLENWGLQMPVAALELNLSELFNNEKHKIN